MAEKLLYYFGAGASANALPLARSVWYNDHLLPGLSAEIQKMGQSLELLEDWTPENKKFAHTLKNRLTALSTKVDEFGDVDTYAKYLLLTSQSSLLSELKQALSCYFVIKQLIEKAKDARYLPWLVSLMSTQIFPKDVKILSWNYDFQLELASQQLGLTLEAVKHSGTGFTYSPSHILHYPNVDPTFSDHKDLSIVHLNGIASMLRESISNTATVFQEDNRNSSDNVMSFLRNNQISQLHFAWEKGNYHTALIEHVEELITGTTILVVIGYSFPFFNRDIDKYIFSSLKKAGTLKKIYYQDRVLDGQQLKPQFNLDKNFDIISIKKVDNFHIPFEY